MYFISWRLRTMAYMTMKYCKSLKICDLLTDICTQFCDFLYSLIKRMQKSYINFASLYFMTLAIIRKSFLLEKHKISDFQCMMTDISDDHNIFWEPYSIAYHSLPWLSLLKHLHLLSFPQTFPLGVSSLYLSLFWMCLFPGFPLFHSVLWLLFAHSRLKNIKSHMIGLKGCNEKSTFVLNIPLLAI